MMVLVAQLVDLSLKTEAVNWSVFPNMHSVLYTDRKCNYAELSLQISFPVGGLSRPVSLAASIRPVPTELLLHRPPSPQSCLHRI